MLSILVVHAANLEDRSVEAEGDCLSQEQVDDMEAAASNVEFLQRAANLKHQKNLEVAAKGCDQCDPAQGDKLSDFSSLEAMQTGGWSLTNINDKIVQYGASYAGWGASLIQGEMVATLQGAGTVTVHLQNDYIGNGVDNLIRVMKNGVDVAHLHKKQELTITFPFLNGDTLTIREKFAMIRLFSVAIECPPAPAPTCSESDCLSCACGSCNTCACGNFCYNFCASTYCGCSACNGQNPNPAMLELNATTAITGNA